MDFRKRLFAFVFGVFAVSVANPTYAERIDFEKEVCAERGTGGVGAAAENEYGVWSQCELSCLDGKLNGKKVCKNDKGRKVLETGYRKGLEDGVRREYVNGVLKYSSVYSAGTLVSSVELDAKGKVVRDVMKDKSSGYFIDYYANGSMKLLCQTYRGNLHGTCISWFESGKLLYIHNLVMGRLEGRQVEYNEYSKECVYNLVDGKRQGKGVCINEKGGIEEY